MATCKVCQHPNRKEIENDIRSGMKLLNRKWKISGKEISQHKYKCMGWSKLLIITKLEFCELCLDRSNCKHKRKIKNCEYWREYCEDMGRSA